ncbi:hypothetical protein [Streptomyces gossypiisoli]|nr:hypothetical protein [Streptomyces gossypiisoli]
MPGGGPRTTVREVGADGHELRLTVNYQGRRRERLAVVTEQLLGM